MQITAIEFCNVCGHRTCRDADGACWKCRQNELESLGPLAVVGFLAAAIVLGFVATVIAVIVLS